MPRDGLNDECILAELGRHQSKARHGGIEGRIDFLVSPIGRRQRSAHLLFEYRDLGAATLKGFADPVQAWQVVGPSAIESRW